MVRTNFLNEVSSTSGRRRWLRVNELPWSRALTYSMLRAGILQSILLTYPGCVKGLRLIDGDSWIGISKVRRTKSSRPVLAKEGRAEVVQRSNELEMKCVRKHDKRSRATCSAGLL